MSAFSRGVAGLFERFNNGSETLKRIRDLSDVTGLGIFDACDAVKLATTTSFTIDEAVRFVRTGLIAPKKPMGVGMEYTRNTTQAHRVTIASGELKAVIIKGLRDKLTELVRMSGHDENVLPPEACADVRVMVRTPGSGPGLVSLEAFLDSSAEIVVDWFESFSDPVR
jgi:hypothetical protein